MHDQTWKQAYDRDGFLVVRQLLSAAEFDELCQNLERYIRDVVPTLPDGDAFYEDRRRPETLKQLQRIQQDPYFGRYLHHPKWTRLAASLLGEPIQVEGAEWFNKPPGTNHITPPHQDNFYFCYEPPQVLTLWMALDAVDEENGCLRYVPGSHRSGIRPHQRTKTLGFSQGISDYGDDDRAHEQPILLQPGDVTIHHGNTIHRADANRSATRQRRSFALVVRGVSARRDPVAFARYASAAKAQREEFGLKN
jgi:phytanoyl-CoA hydroxylase